MSWTPDSIDTYSRVRTLFFSAGLLAWGALPLTAQAADAEGSYAIRGAGANTCEQFQSHLSEDSATATAYASWQEGYLTAFNRFADDTFDSVPVMSSSQLLAMVRNVCADNPEIRVETALARLTNLFMPVRVTEASSPVTISVGETSTVLRQATLARVQQLLREQGHEAVEATGRFDDATRDALRAYQEAQELAATGVPDADTLIRLFFMQPE